MAALATAAISRVGTETSGAQVQVTVTMTVPAKAAPTNAPSSALQIPGAATTPSDVAVTPSSSDASSATRVQAALSVRTVTVRTTQPAALATAPTAVSTAPVATVPVSQPANTTTPTKTPTATKPTTATKTPTPSASTSTRPPITSSNAQHTWWHHQGGIHAACHGDNLAYAEPWAEKGYKVVKQAGWFRTAIIFKGSTPVTVLVGCHGGHPSFTTSG